jgi:hypothetical protein
MHPVFQIDSSQMQATTGSTAIQIDYFHVLG